MILADVLRSGFVESSHHGSLVALDPAGAVVLSAGTPEQPIFPRSSNKPMQLGAMLRLGVAEKLDLSEEHLAIATASHSAEEVHVTLVEDLLSRAGRTAADLRCPGGVTHNCSGKHAAMLATCVVQGWPTEDYQAPDHPLQVHIAAVVEELAGERIAAVGVDGCGAPVLALTLIGLARAFGRIDPRVADAIRAHPLLVGGTEQDVTKLLTAVPGLVAKDGAEAVFAAALPGGTTVALKIADGAPRAATPVLVAALRALGADGDEEALSALASPPVLGGGIPVGQVLARPLAIASTGC